MRWKWPLGMLLLAAGAVVAVAYLRPDAVRASSKAVATALKLLKPGHDPEPGPTPPDRAPVTADERSAAAAERSPGWDGLVRLDSAQREGIGLETVEVLPQTRPIKIELPGTTAYDTNTLTKIRPRFTSVVDRVYKENGQAVKKGDPLVDLFSAELAQAKIDFREKYAQWFHDKNLLEKNRKLLQQKAVSEQKFRDAENDEKKSWLEFTVTRDKLTVYGLTEEEVAAIQAADDSSDRDPLKARGKQIASMTLRSPSDGIVIKREVVKGNVYDNNDDLLVIAPLDHLWVWVNVFESDLKKVKKGRLMEIEFPYLNQVAQGEVEYIANEVDPETHAVRVRASIPNTGGLKADMLVRARLEIPPEKGRTVIPRVAMVTSGGDHYYVFVRAGSDPGVFERRAIQPVQERDDYVVVGEGLKPREQVVTTGSLILAQKYEDDYTAAFGIPLSEHTQREVMPTAGRSEGFDFHPAGVYDRAGEGSPGATPRPVASPSPAPGH